MKAPSSQMLIVDDVRDDRKPFGQYLDKPIIEAMPRAPL